MLLRLVFHLFDIRLLSCMRGLPWWLDLLLWCEGAARRHSRADPRSGGAFRRWAGDHGDCRGRDRVCRVSLSSCRCRGLHGTRRAAPRAPELTSTLSSAAAADVGPKFLETACGGRNGRFLALATFGVETKSTGKMDLAASLRDINFTGFCRVQMPFNALQELAVAMERLQQNGFPPAASVAQILPKIF